MSTILKALKKLEEEKSRRKEGGGDLARDILLGETQRQRPSLWPFVAVGGVLLLLATGGLYVTLRGEPTASLAISSPASLAREEATERSVSESSSVEVKIERVPVVPIVAVPSSPPVGSDHVESVPSTSGAKASRPVKIAPSAPAMTRDAEPMPAAATPTPMSAEDAGDMPPLGAEPVPVAVENTAPASHDQSSGGRGEFTQPSLTVSGIAFQEQREARMAIVNGLPVMEGSNTDGGARVEEILADRVRFTTEGRSFEVLLEDR